MGKKSTTPKIHDVKITPKADPDGEWYLSRDGAWTLRFGTLKLYIHQFVGYPASQLFVTCHSIGMQQRSLVSAGIEDAKREAFDMVHATVAEWMRGMTTFHEGQAK